MFHPVAMTAVLNTSAALKRAIHEMARHTGMTTSRLHKCEVRPALQLMLGYQEVYKRDNPYAKRINRDYSWRNPKRLDFEAASKGAQSVHRLHADPLIAIEILADRFPEAFLE
jgi:hypothetical protein